MDHDLRRVASESDQRARGYRGFESGEHLRVFDVGAIGRVEVTDPELAGDRETEGEVVSRDHFVGVRDANNVHIALVCGWVSPHDTGPSDGDMCADVEFHNVRWRFAKTLALADMVGVFGVRRNEEGHRRHGHVRARVPVLFADIGGHRILLLKPHHLGPSHSEWRAMPSVIVPPEEA